MADRLIHLKIITPNGTFFDDDVSIVTVKTTEGYMGVLYNHIPTVASIAISELHIGAPGEKNYQLCAISGGLLCVEKEVVTIITDAIEFQSQIDINRAEDALVRAQKLLKEKNDPSIEMSGELSLARATNRINLIKQGKK